MFIVFYWTNFCVLKEKLKAVNQVSRLEQFITTYFFLIFYSLTCFNDFLYQNIFFEFHIISRYLKEKFREINNSSISYELMTASCFIIFAEKRAFYDFKLKMRVFSFYILTQITSFLMNFLERSE